MGLGLTCGARGILRYTQQPAAHSTLHTRADSTVGPCGQIRINLNPEISNRSPELDTTSAYLVRRSPSSPRGPREHKSAVWIQLQHPRRKFLLTWLIMFQEREYGLRKSRHTSFTDCIVHGRSSRDRTITDHSSGPLRSTAHAKPQDIITLLVGGTSQGSHRTKKCAAPAPSQAPVPLPL